MSVFRIDRASIGAAIRLDSGMLKVPARLTRVGVFTYYNADGSTTRELRLPEEVFAPESLASFELLPFVEEHPVREPGAAVTAKNAGKLSRGSVGGVHRDSKDPNYVAATIMVTDADTVSKIDLGKREISLGYYADKEPAPAGSVYKDPVTGDTQPYDLIQRNIRGNHVALVMHGRAGPEARILLDSTEAIAVEWSGRVTSAPNSTGPSLADLKATPKMKIQIDGLEVELDANTHALVSKTLANAKSETEKAVARADAADSQVLKLNAELTAAKDPAVLAEAVKARVEVESVANAHGIKCDGLSNLDVRKAVIAKIDSSIKLDGKSEDYVVAMFDALNRSASVTKTITDSAPSSTKAAEVKDSANLKRAFTDAFFGAKK